MSDLDRFFRPKSVAVVGGTEAARVVEQLDLFGYGGEVWPIHPTREAIGGRTCLKSVSELPDTPDVAFVGVPRESAAAVVTQLSEMGCGGAVVYASGYGEAGEHNLETALLDAAGEMPFLGPNAYGYVNALDGTAIWPDLHGLKPISSGVGIITQSGNIGINLTMARRSLDIALLVTAGNQADVDIPKLMEALLDDPRITSIGLELESIDDSNAFGRAALRAVEQGVPIVVLKMGTSERGATATASHTGAMAGEDAVYEALFEFYGIARVRSIPTFLEALKLAGTVGSRPRVLSLSASGGEAAHVADLASIYGVDLPEVTPEHVESVRQTTHPLVVVSNPMDYHTISWGDGPALRATFEALASGPFDVAILLLDFPEDPVPTDWWTTAHAFAEAMSHLPALVVSTLPESMSAETQSRLRGEGLIPMLGLVETFEALGAVGRVRKPNTVHQPQRAFDEGTTLDEAKAKSMLSQVGLSIPAGYVTSLPENSEISYPVTIKALGFDHKTRVGAAAIGVRDAQSLNSVLAEMPKADQYLIEETVSGILAELLINLRSTNLGWQLTIGNGGTKVEEINDSSHLLMPATHDDIARCIGRLRMARALSELVPDMTVLSEFVNSLWKLIESDPTIVEIEINPIALRHQGAIVLDAMVVVSSGATP